MGTQSEELVRLMTNNKRIGYIPNALDFSDVNMERRNEGIKSDMQELSKLGLKVEILDLRDYFSRTDKLRERMKQLGGIFICGGNTFILRQAMKLSGFEILFEELLKRDDFVYSGYSAGICVLAPSIRPVQIVDSPTDNPYKELQEVVWEGLGYLDYIILPHYKSNHPESAGIDKVVDYCERNSIPFKTLKDGEAIIIE